MQRNLTCKNGHSWAAAADEWDSVSPEQKRCSACGEMGVVARTASSGDLATQRISAPGAAETMEQPAHTKADEPFPTVRFPGGFDSESPLLAASIAATFDISMSESAEKVDVPGYEILDELGRGGMGVVYKARHIRLNRIVALKMILDSVYAGQMARERFKSEALAVARIQHPNIVQIYDVDDAHGRPYFCLEFVSGGSLSEWLRAVPPPTHKESALLVEQISRAMHAAHQNGIVHRDLKPANILLQREDRASVSAAQTKVSAAAAKSHHLSVVPKVADFGLAKDLGPNSSGFTRTGDIVGTPSYMAPEQATGRNSLIGPLTDVYALGAILYECITGKPPFRSETPFDTLIAVAHDEPIAPSKLQRKLAPELEVITLKCLEKLPSRRYPSAEALADDLRAFVEGREITARPASNARKVVQWIRRHPAISSLTAVVVLATAAIIGVQVYYNWQLESKNVALTDAMGTIELGMRKEKQLSGQLAIQLSQTQAANAKALENFGKARQAVRAMTGSMSEPWMQYVPQLDMVRKSMLERAIMFHEQFVAQEGSTDPTVLAEAGAAQLEAGKARQMLGRFEQAERSYRKSIDLLKNQLNNSRMLGDAYFQLGELFKEMGRDSDAVAAYDEAQKLQVKMPSARGDLARTKHSNAQALQHMSDLPGAVAEFTKALALHEQLAGELPDAIEHRFNQAGTLNQLGGVRMQQQQFDEAAKLYDASLKLCDDLVKAEPINPELRERRAATNKNIGVFRRTLAATEPGTAKTKSLTSAADALNASIADWSQLTRDYRSTPSYRHELAQAQNTLGNVLEQLDGRSADARDAYQKALASQESLIGEFSQVPEWRSGLAVILDNLATHLLIRDPKNPVESRRLSELALPHHAAVLKLTPDDPLRRKLLRNHLAVHSEAMLANNEPLTAAKFAEQYPQPNNERPEDLVFAARLLARCSVKIDPDNSQRLQQLSLDFLRRAFEKAKSDPDMLRQQLDALRGPDFTNMRANAAFRTLFEEWKKTVEQ